MEKLDSMDKKLDKLDVIEKKLDSMDRKLDKLDDILIAIKELTRVIKNDKRFQTSG